MIVTDKKYAMENRLIEKLDLMIKRMSDKYKKDNLLIIDGDEGEGKTDMSIASGYYVSYKTKRNFDVNTLKFDVEELINYAILNKRKIIIWDEGALGGLSEEWFNKAQIKLIKMLMVCRKKRHFFIINIPRFSKLREYLAVDRAIGLIHVYSPDGLEVGRFTYYNKKAKEKLYFELKSKKRDAYKRNYTFRGLFPYVLPKIIDEPKYEANKDKAILSLLKDEQDKSTRELIELKYKISKIKGISQEDLAKSLKITRRTLQRWRKLDNNYNFLRELGWEGRQRTNYNNKVVI